MFTRTLRLRRHLRGLLLAGGLLLVQNAFGATYLTITIQQATSTTAVSINNRGQVIGSADCDGYMRDADGKITMIVVSGATCTVPTVINNQGQVAGIATLSDGSTVGFLRGHQGNITTFAQPGFGVYVSGIDDDGNVAGGYIGGSNGSLAYGFRWNEQTGFLLITPTGAHQVYISGISPGGILIGNYIAETPYRYFGFLRYPSGEIVAVGASTGATYTHTLAVNDSGTATGYSTPYDPSTFIKAWVADKGSSFQNLVIGFPGSNWRAYSINAAGLVVGSVSQTAGVSRGFMRFADGTERYFHIPNVVSPYYFAFLAYHVNDLNQIVGTYKDSIGAQHGYIRLPTNSLQVNGLVSDTTAVEGD